MPIEFWDEMYGEDADGNRGEMRTFDEIRSDITGHELYSNEVIKFGDNICSLNEIKGKETNLNEIYEIYNDKHFIIHGLTGKCHIEKNEDTLQLIQDSSNKKLSISENPLYLNEDKSVVIRNILEFVQIDIENYLKEKNLSDYHFYPQNSKEDINISIKDGQFEMFVIHEDGTKEKYEKEDMNFYIDSEGQLYEEGCSFDDIESEGKKEFENFYESELYDYRWGFEYDYYDE